MFEKSLYDLIRGLRNHKGAERQYIQDSIRECRREIRSNSMDLKATALLKLTYLEMFGHDMSWASFNVLEVMSSSNYSQKRIGYLSAIQSFRADTEVLMLAENLLKKDLTSGDVSVVQLPLIAVPHVVSPSMANSLLGDLLPRLTHSNPGIRKKTIVTIYRLALVYPETLRPAWPKIKERLQDETEDPSVTSAIVNVVCELGWRRPQDFLPLAPRLFDLLTVVTDGQNNWMRIKIIKLFATLTPVEPRLIKKLLPPLTNLIKTTAAMSLLYECIHGIIEGGILASVEGTAEGDELARLCVGKLRSMLIIEGDPNLKYVALLAFQKIVTGHPYLVSLHQDAILDCIDNADVTIRMRALDLAVGMVNSDNLQLIVNKLLSQLLSAPYETTPDDSLNDRGMHEGVEPRADYDEEDMAETLRRRQEKADEPVALPPDYRANAIQNIISMCSRDTYANVQDFDWYIEVLVKLVKACPSMSISGTNTVANDDRDISYVIGEELQNVAIRVKSMRLEACLAAQLLLMIDHRPDYFPPTGNGGQGVLGPCAWITGEYAEHLTNAEGVLDSLTHSSSLELPSHALSVFIHAVLKIFASICARLGPSWSLGTKMKVGLLTARIIHYLEKLSFHTALEVQERAVEYLELLRLASEASSQADAEVGPPLLLTQAIPNLFIGAEINPVAPGALRKVPLPDNLDLDTPVNPNLQAILETANAEDASALASDEFAYFYNQRPEQPSTVKSTRDLLEPDYEPESYQQVSAADQLDAAELAAKRKERRERNKEDPFYIGDGTESTASSSLRNIIKSTNGEDLDIDSIPIMDLSLDVPSSGNRTPTESEIEQQKERARRAASRKRIEIVSDETIDGPESLPSRTLPSVSSRSKRAVLGLDSGGLAALSLDDSGKGRTKLEIEQREEEERALREVERLRLEMQRASERIQAKEEAVVVKRKKKKTKAALDGDDADAAEVLDDDGTTDAGPKKKKKKKKRVKDAGDRDQTSQTQSGEKAEEEMEPDVAQKKKRKKRIVPIDEG